ncbi:MAG TPA: PKD domain-containing protein [Candidatus Paceibacterota bacterium]|nr:MAG: hypothetical protein B7X03_00010 [Parcubacteria group bacterium 21-58-10]HQT82918.1 PKD domain-containing protein [Candidatus Paceibacterota bacterium]
MSSAPLLRRLRSSLPVLVIVALGVLLTLHGTANASAMSLSGYAWSSNTGWISFSGPGYGVSEDSVSGALSGYAWSSNIGWISFNASDGSHPAPAVNFVTGKVTGWALACAAFANKNACSGALDGNSGGWDGWISLSGTASDGSSYGMVQSPTCGWTGYAWGSTPVGWISASGTATNGSTYGVTGSSQAICAGQIVTTCTGSPASPYVNQPVTWSSSTVGGSGSYTYSWTGTDGLSGSTASVQKTYITAGQKSASVTVTDTITHSSTTATCTDSGTGTQGVPVQACTSTLTATPSTVNQGQNTTLTWSVPGGSTCATSCSGGSGFNTGGAISNSTGVSATVPPSPPTTSYALTCTGGTYGPPPPANATVTVIVPSVTTFTVNGQTGTARVNPATPNNVSIAWSSADATSCTVTKNPTSTGWPKTGLSSAGTTDSITTQTVYAIDCVNSYGTSAKASVIVNVLAHLQEF